MNVLLYAPRAGAPAGKLNKVIEKLTTDGRKEMCRSFEGLSRRLKYRSGEEFIGVFLASDEQDLTDLLLLQEDLQGIRFVLVLPDDSEKTLSKAHALGPRYISYADGDFVDVAAVVEKMIHNMERRRNRGYHAL
jgi:hypothetical protein